MAFTDWSITMGPQEGVDELNGRFNTTVGHEHDGTNGGGKKISGSSVINVPSGNISAINMQDAINELDSEKLPVSNAFGGNKNKIINGNFAINQRGVSGTVTLTAGKYGHDRWKAGTSGCTYTFETVENITTLTITAGSLLQIIEGNNLFSGTYTLSWQGTAQGKIGNSSYSDSGVTCAVTGGTNLNIEFNIGTLLLVQFEHGSLATPFELRNIGQELSLCERYYEKSYNTTVAPGTITYDGVYSFSYISPNRPQVSPQFNVTKRTSPTVTIYNPLTGTVGQMYDIDSLSNKAAGTPTFVGVKCFSVHPSTTTTLGELIVFHWVADAEI